MHTHNNDDFTLHRASGVCKILAQEAGFPLSSLSCAFLSTPFTNAVAVSGTIDKMAFRLVCAHKRVNHLRFMALFMGWSIDIMTPHLWERCLSLAALPLSDFDSDLLLHQGLLRVVLLLQLFFLRVVSLY